MWQRGDACKGVACVVGGVHGRGCVHGRGTCVAGGYVWQGGIHAWQGEGCAWQGACVTGGDAWQGECVAIGCMAGGACMVGDMCDRCVCVWQGGMHAREMATEAGNTHPTRMHSRFSYLCSE